jgi:hypothetical protein
MSGTTTAAPRKVVQGQLVKRRIDVTFTLNPTTSLSDPSVTQRPVFVESGGNEVKLTGHRVSAAIKKAGGYSMGELQLRMYGLTMSLVNQISTLGRLPLAGRNTTVTVAAGDDLNGMGTVFQGTVTNAWADFKAAPDAAFHVTAHAGMAAQQQVIPPTSFAGSASVAVIMAGLATQMGLAFENNGVEAVLADPYLPGTARQQATACAEAAGIDLIIDDQTLIITPRGAARGAQAPLISRDTTLVGYPAYTQNGIAVTCIFNPNVALHGLVRVESVLAPATGNWRVFDLVHDLEADTPGGAWFTAFQASEPQLSPVRTSAPQ